MADSMNFNKMSALRWIALEDKHLNTSCYSCWCVMSFNSLSPCTRATDNIHNFSRKEALFDISVHIITYLMQTWAVGKCCQVQKGDEQRIGKALKIKSGFPLALQGLLVGQAGLPRHGTAPYKTVTQNGPLKEFTGKTKTQCVMFLTILTPIYTDMNVLITTDY